jgi:hypothetical protein
VLAASGNPHWPGCARQLVVPGLVAGGVDEGGALVAEGEMVGVGEEEGDWVAVGVGVGVPVEALGEVLGDADAVGVVLGDEVPDGGTVGGVVGVAVGGVRADTHCCNHSMSAGVRAS